MLDTTEINKERKALNQQNMVFIDGGSFMMGSDKFYPEEKPVHKVTVDAFWMAKCPVTHKAFSDFVSAPKSLTVAARP
jgi:sulfatase modifying factor 1